MKIAVFVSGGGTNLQAIMDWIQSDRLCKVEIVRVIASREGTFAEQRARNASIPVTVVSRKDYPTQEGYDQALLDTLCDDAVDLVVLAGFLSFLGPDFIRRYKNRIINIHPALLPAFCGKGMYGLKPHAAAIDAGVKVTGATVHFVDDAYDKGPIILQKPVLVRDDDTPEELQKRVMKEAEQVILPLAIRLFSEGAIHIEGNRTRISGQGHPCIIDKDKIQST